MADYTGSFSGSYTGNGSGLTNIDYYDLANLPTTIVPFQKNSILANNSLRDNFVSNVKTRLDAEGVISGSSQVILNDADKTGFDTTDVVEGSNLYYTEVRVKDKLNSEGVISGSDQIDHNTTINFKANEHIDHTSVSFTAGNGLIGGGTIASSRTFNIVSENNGIIINNDNIQLDNSSNTFTDGVKAKLNVESVISSSAQLIPEFDIRYGNELGDDLVSGSAQVDVTLTTNYSSINQYSDDKVKNKLNVENVISSSAQLISEFDIRYGNELGDGLVSGSAQIDYNSIQNKPTTITNEQANNIIINNSKVGYEDSLVKTKLDTEGVISGSSQVTITESQISDLQSYLTSLPAGTISGSSQVTITESQISDLQSYLTSLPAGTISGSSQVTITESQISDLQSYLTALPAGTISSSAQIAELGYLTSETDSQTLTYVGDTLTISNGNSVTIPTGSDLPDGLVSGSVLRTLDGTGVLSGSKTEIPAGTISGSSQIAALGYLTSETDSQTLTLAGNNLSISNGNSVSLAGLGGGGSGGSSIWNTGSQDPSSYTHLITSNNLQVTGSVDIKGDFTVNGQSVFTQTSESDAGNALVVKGRIKVLEEQIGSYIASASMQIGNSQDTIDCGGFF